MAAYIDATIIRRGVLSTPFPLNDFSQGAYSIHPLKRRIAVTHLYRHALIAIVINPFRLDQGATGLKGRGTPIANELTYENCSKISPIDTNRGVCVNRHGSNFARTLSFCGSISSACCQWRRASSSLP